MAINWGDVGTKLNFLISTITGNPEAQKSINGAACVTQIDASGKQIGGAFAPSDQGADLTGSAASQAQALAIGTSYIRFDVLTADCRIKFGTAGVTVTATTGSRFRAGTTEKVAVPIGATYFAFIGNTSSINWTPS